jgi:thymidine phosphorylase
MLIRIERVLDLDAKGQLIASVLSKKIAAGATHVVLDTQVGPTAKVRSTEAAAALAEGLAAVAQAFGLGLRVETGDGAQPIGRGIGPALEARDVLAVHADEAPALADLSARVAKLAGAPEDRAAGLELHVRLGQQVARGEPLFTVQAETAGELDDALADMAANPELLEAAPG